MDRQAAPGRHLPQRQGRDRRGRAVHDPAGGRPQGADVGRRQPGADHRLRRDQEGRRHDRRSSQLKTPYAILDNLLAEYTFGIIPADFDPKNPVGTGAFSYESFTPGKNSVFKKYADYWGDPAFVDELHIQDFADDNAKVNALLAGQIQTIDNLPYNLIDSVKGQGGQILSADTGAWVPFTMRVDTTPFSDVRVRQALRLIVDRQQMIDQALSGYGSLGNDLYAPFDPAYAKDLPQREQDIDQAKSLLKSAGQEGLQVELFTGDDIGSVAPAAANLFAEQAKKAGVDVKVVKKNPVLRRRLPLLPVRPGLLEHPPLHPAGRRVRVLKGGTYNETHLDNPKFTGLIDGGRSGRSTRPSAPTLLQDAQQIEYDEGGYIIWGFRRQVDGVLAARSRASSRASTSRSAPTSSSTPRSRA